MSSETQIAVRPPLVKASTELSAYLGMEVSAMIDALKSQAFKGKRPEEVTDAQLATYISTANALKLNPLLPGQMYAYPDRQGGGVTVMIGPDGVFTLLSNHPDVVAQKDGGPAFWTEFNAGDPANETCTGYINHRTKGLLKKTIWIQEWVVSSNPNWASRRHHMAEIRALKQVARMVIHGLPVDSDEHKLGEMLNVTDTAQPEAAQAEAIVRPPPKERSKKGAAAVAENPPTQAAIEVQTTAAATDTKVEKLAVKLADPVEVAAAVAVAEQVPVSRAFLKDAEILTCICEVVEVFPELMSRAGVTSPGVQANVKGGYVGSVIDFGGASGTDPDNLTPDPLWVPGNKLELTLQGKLGKKSGKVQASVTGKKLVEASKVPTEVD